MHPTDTKDISTNSFLRLCTALCASRLEVTTVILTGNHLVSFSLVLLVYHRVAVSEIERSGFSSILRA